LLYVDCFFLTFFPSSLRLRDKMTLQQHDRTRSHFIEESGRQWALCYAVFSEVYLVLKVDACLLFWQAVTHFATGFNYLNSDDLWGKAECVRSHRQTGGCEIDARRCW